ncbi:hypothetical protein [Microbulbifer taiwanensis]
MDFAISAGVGWRLFGDDELSLQAQFSNARAGGDKAGSVYLNYSKYFGR